VDREEEVISLALVCTSAPINICKATIVALHILIGALVVQPLVDYGWGMVGPMVGEWLDQLLGNGWTNGRGTVGKVDIING
jgi:hypothetical protein